MTSNRVTTMRPQFTPLLMVGLVALGALVACGGSDDKAATTTTAAPATTGPPATTASGTSPAGASTTLRTTLQGGSEVPGPGDPSATGAAVIYLDGTTPQVCWEVTAVGLNPPADKAHIHRGEVGQAGDVVVTLTPPPAGRNASNGCAPVDASLITELTDTPQAFYVNVHNPNYPSGAIRGQLSKAG